jgi:hypothetical protein
MGKRNMQLRRNYCTRHYYGWNGCRKIDFVNVGFADPFKSPKPRLISVGAIFCAVYGFDYGSCFGPYASVSFH